MEGGREERKEGGGGRGGVGPREGILSIILSHLCSSSAPRRLLSSSLPVAPHAPFVALQSALFISFTPITAPRSACPRCPARCDFCQLPSRRSITAQQPAGMTKALLNSLPLRPFSGRVLAVAWKLGEWAQRAKIAVNKSCPRVQMSKHKIPGGGSSCYLVFPSPNWCE